MRQGELKERCEFVIGVSRSVGRALLSLRETKLPTKRMGDQLKSAADIAAESWVLSLIKSKYPKEPILSEEKYDREKSFRLHGRSFWVVDALDGTRSFHGGFNGFCVQIAYVDKGKVKLGVVYWPVRDIVYFAVDGKGAFKINRDKKKQMGVKKGKKIFSYIDNKPPANKTKHIISEIGGRRFIEMGSFGLKLCQVAEGRADVFVKRSSFKIWDVAAGDLILSESGCRLGKWNGEKISYDLGYIQSKNIYATSLKNFPLVGEILNANRN